MMRFLIRYSMVVLLLGVGCWPVLAASHLSVSTGTLRLDGDSTLHPFYSQTSNVQVKADIDPGATDPLPAILDKQALKHFDFSLPVTSLKSKEGGLDENMYKALKAEQCPTIEFHMTQYEVKTSSGDVRPVRASGTLRVACQEKAVTLDASLKPESGTLRVTGQYALLMSDYGIKPPTMMMGTIKVKDNVIIHYDLGLTPQ